MDARTCQTRIASAQTDDEVLALVREYIAGLPPERLARLPAEARPGPFAERDDVVAYNVQLARSELLFEGAPEDAAFMKEMLSVTSQAAVRFSQLSFDARLRPPS